MCRPLFMTLACLMVLFGISGLWMLPKLIQQKIEQRIQLKIGTKNFDRFTKVPIPITVKFYLFNITNKDQVLAGKEGPKFEEVGPFVYKQWRRREIVDFEDYNRRVKYREYKTFYPVIDFKALEQNAKHSKHNGNNNEQTKPILFEHDVYGAHNSSSGSQENNAQDSSKLKMLNQNVILNPYKTNVTIINLPLLTALTKLSSFKDGSFKRSVIAKIASRLIEDRQDRILITKPANEILFDGYKVDFMESVRDLISGTLGLNFESPLPNNKFGFFYLKNNTWTKRENGEITIFSGRNESMDDFMLIENWNDLKELSVWPTNTEAGNRCNQVKGTDGSQFHPDVKRSQLLSIFSPQICTSIYIKYKEDTQTRGIPLLRFTTPAELFAAPKKNPKNACYCTIPASNGNGAESGSQAKQEQQKSSKTSAGITDSRCYLDGLLDLSLCQRGAPVAASSPHFYNGDPLLAMAAGLKPNKEIHETYIDVEPMTGAVMRAASRVQLNAYVERAALEVLDASVIGRMTPMVAPMLWLEESAEIDEKNSEELKKQLFNTVNKAKRSFVYAIVIGILLIVGISAQFWYFACYRIRTPQLERTKRIPLSVSSRARRKQVGHLERNLRGYDAGGDGGSDDAAASKVESPLLIASPSSSGLKRPARAARSRDVAGSEGLALGEAS